MKKILFLAKGSNTDPGFDSLRVGNVNCREYFKRRGIDVVQVVESCHGCHDIVADYSKQLQELVEKGNRVVGVFQGGLYFALPSIQATQVTFPIISVPLDITAYQAFMVPSGNAVIATVAVERKRDEKIYNAFQRVKALKIAEKMLNLEEHIISIHVTADVDGTKLYKKLNELGIAFLGTEESKKENRILLNYGSTIRYDLNSNNIFIWAINHDNFGLGRHYDNLESSIERKEILQVRGAENLAIYAAKIISLQRPELIPQLKEIAEKKRASYEHRDLIKEFGG